MTGCIGEPVSWLRLERYALGELPVRERAAVEEHLRVCPACEACHREIADSDLELPPLAAPKPVVRKLRPRWTWVGVAGAAVAVAAGVLLMVKGPGLEPPEARRSVKGGELSVELVRLGADGRMREPDRYEPGDRFKVLFTCPPPWRGVAEVVVYQGGQAFFPLDLQTIDACGNRRGLEGAFQLDGDVEAFVCVATAERALDRASLARGVESLPERSVCARLAPVR